MRGDYHAERLAIDSESAQVMRAMADHQADVGLTPAAIGLYERLIEKIRKTSPEVANDPRNAHSMSLLNDSLAKLRRARTN